MKNVLLAFAMLPCLALAPVAEPDIGQQLGTGEGASTGTTCVVTLATAQTAGRKVYAAFGNLTTSRAPTGVADSQSGSWTLVHNHNNITNAETYLYARTAGATLGIGDTVTITYNGTTVSVGAVWDAIGSSTSYSVRGSHASTGTTPSITVTRTLTDSLTFACVTENAALLDADLTQDADYTTLVNKPHTTDNLRLTVGYRDQTASGGDTWSVTLSGSRAFAAVMADFGVPSTVKNNLIPMTGGG